ncbi:hypothetical protein [Sporosarcina sp.]|uniref:hypothetical protein n=1 Tax=Sporosarcina sp. TaxID=49982 RepID=UPI0026173768|nr:hypothetical protein [Sporosarcina sp.]
MNLLLSFIHLGVTGQAVHVKTTKSPSTPTCYERQRKRYEQVRSLYERLAGRYERLTVE